ncbi:hypothetical protein BCR34DRAFT_562118 [Clohesyomyces aquaticus]|uniref:Uncharacterized protein n=1 Tax=Clohesyomyces aquaticus TaxID=1231657 RepID=A0A1Y1ZT25_9PLEO|nr:hypothetical protein BCR34DRAFT_562118 [Clohesyomyces aquaticus]
MASRTSTPRSRSHSRSSTGSSGSSDTTMLDADAPPPLGPAQPRPAAHSTPSATSEPSTKDPAFSLILCLPRELRDKVYTFALASPFPFWWPAATSPKHDVALGLLRVARQIHKEATPILYLANKFLFTHPSDCNIFRVISSPCSSRITSACFRIREKDLRLWTTYLGSKQQERSLMADLPNLKSLWIFLRVGNVGPPGVIVQLPGGNAMANLPPAAQAHAQAAQHAVQQHIYSINQGIHINPHGRVEPIPGLGQAAAPPVHMMTGANGPGPLAPHADAGGDIDDENDDDDRNMVVIPPPPPAAAPAMPFQTFAANLVAHHHPNPPQPFQTPHLGPGVQGAINAIQPIPPAPPHNANALQSQIPLPPPPPPAPGQGQATHHTNFLRWERELGLESLCLSLQETRPKDVDIKIVCIMRCPRSEVERLVQRFAADLSVDRNGDARTRFRRLLGTEVSLEIAGYDVG